ncbi:helix-turn-helix transcriptional regulator [Lacrimispora sp.]|uniref:helix-turn-helix domain-containing protein n=1 Tax=Lacrimispora sp. TaxID=2719234 RepID=UPI0032E42B96
MDRKDGLDSRIRNVRKELKMSQKEFAERMGVSQGTVSWSEQPDKNVPDSTIKSICTIFNVNENYLLYDESPMFIEPDTFSLDNFIVERGGTDLEKEIIKTYFELDPEVRKAIFDHFKNKFFPPPKPKSGFVDIPSSDELLEMYPDLLKEDEKGIS